MLGHMEAEHAQSAAVQAHSLEAQAYAHAEAQAHTIAHVHSLEAQAQSHAQQAHQAQVQAHSLSVQAQSLQVRLHLPRVLLACPGYAHLYDCASHARILSQIACRYQPQTMLLQQQLDMNVLAKPFFCAFQATAQHLEAKAQEIVVPEHQHVSLLVPGL